MTEIFDRDLTEIFPEYLGFGILDFDSLSIVCPTDGITKEYARAQYLTRERDLVYHIRVGEESCTIEEYYKGDIIGIASSMDLLGAFKQMFFSFNGNDHPRFQEIVARVGQGRNIHLAFPDTPARVYTVFPAGRILVLRFPVVGAHRLEKIEREFKDIKTPLRFEGLHAGAVIKFSSNYELTHESLPVVEFSTTLLEFEEAGEFCFEQDLVAVSDLPELSLQVLDMSSALPGSFGIHPGDRKQLLYYGVLLQREGDIPLKTALDEVEKWVFLNEADMIPAISDLVM
ncbi:hypothetical protein ACFL4N_01470 [Thermodesulfobacteriota bacterium]